MTQLAAVTPTNVEMASLVAEKSVMMETEILGMDAQRTAEL
jgi:hypothetical protein